jgi:hypothetical protein
MSPIEAFSFPLPPAARIVAMYLAHEGGEHRLTDICERCNLAPWEGEDALRVLSRPEDCWLAVRNDTERVELKVGTPFDSLFASRRGAKKEKPHAVDG